MNMVAGQHETAEGLAEHRGWPSQIFYPVVGALTLVTSIVWLFLPWAWSPVDDPGQVLTLSREIAESGRISGTLNRIMQLAGAEGFGDKGSGIFRPAAWIYPALVYQLPVALAHLVRLLMVVAVILGPLAYFRRCGASSRRLWLTLLIIVAAASTLYQGLFLLSIQELGGAAFVGLGLVARRNSTRIVFWLIAALFKAPFAWLLVGNAVFLWRQKKRLQAAISGGLGLGILAISALWSRNGSYASSYNPNLRDLAIYENFSRLVEPMNALLLVGLVWWLISTNGSVKRHADSFLFLIAWAGYTLTMIPWGVTAYYMGPISYLFGIFLASVLVDNERTNGRQVFIGLIMPAFVAFWLARITLNFGFEVNSVMYESKQCLAPLSHSSTVITGRLLYVTTSYEGPIRIMEQLRLDDPNWDGSVTLEDTALTGFSNPDTTHYLTIGGALIPEGRSYTQVCNQSAITLYELGPVKVPSGA